MKQLSVNENRLLISTPRGVGSQPRLERLYDTVCTPFEYEKIVLVNLSIPTERPIFKLLYAFLSQIRFSASNKEVFPLPLLPVNTYTPLVGTSNSKDAMLRSLVIVTFDILVTRS